MDLSSAFNFFTMNFFRMLSSDFNSIIQLFWIQTSQIWIFQMVARKKMKQRENKCILSRRVREGKENEWEKIKLSFKFYQKKLNWNWEKLNTEHFFHDRKSIIQYSFDFYGLSFQFFSTTSIKPLSWLQLIVGSWFMD